MNILLLGSGGREHALAWKIAASPLADRLYCAPGNAGIAQEAECVALDIADHAAVIAFCKANKIDFVVVGPEAPLVAGIVDDLEAAGFKTFGPSKAGGAARRLQGLHQGPVPRQQHPDRGLRALHRRRAGEGLCPRAGRADRGQGRRARRRQGRGRGADACRGRGRDRHDVRRRAGRGRRRGRDRGISGGEEASFFALCDGETAIAARLGAGPQARLRRRHGPEHRRHGRLFAGAGDDAGDDRAHHGRDRRADDARHEGDGRAVQGRAVRRPDDHRAGPEADRIQRPLRRSGMPGADAAADVGPACRR